MWVFLFIGLTIPLIALAAYNNQTETNTKLTDPNVPYNEITYKPEKLQPFPVGTTQCTTCEIKTQSTPILTRDFEKLEQSSDALTELLRRESGNNPLAVNPSSGACGLGQALPCSKMLNAIGVATLEEASYEAQLAWMMNYITARYGTPENALAFHDSHGWY